MSIADGGSPPSAPKSGGAEAPSAQPDWSLATVALDPALLSQLANQFFRSQPTQAAAVPNLPAAPNLVGAPTLPVSQTQLSSTAAPLPNLPGGQLPLSNFYFLDQSLMTPSAVPGAAEMAATGGVPASAASLDPFSFGLDPLSARGPLAVPASEAEVASLAGPMMTTPGGWSSQDGNFSLGSLPGSSFYFLDEARAAGATVPATTPALQAAPLGPSTAAVASMPPGASPRATALPSIAPFDPFSFAPSLLPDLGLSNQPFDVAAVRRDFPILDQSVHGHPLVWLDSAATTQKPRQVIERMKLFFERENSNIHRAAHTLAGRSTDAYEAAREKVRRFLNAPSSKEIVFVRGATEAINLVAQSWGRRYVGEDDEILITWLEHHSNIVPWQLLAAEKGAKLKVAPIDDRGDVRLDEFEKLLSPRTRIVSFTHVSNALGTIAPVRDLAAMAHRHGARVLVDGAQAVSHLAVDVQQLDCDFYAFSGHKVFAPTGIGVLYGKPDALAEMPPWQGGGNMISDVTFEKTMYQPPPGRFEAGTGSIADAVGLGAAIDYVMALGMPNITRHEHELLGYATQELQRIPGLHLIGTAANKAGVLSFVLDNYRSEDVGTALDAHGIAVRAGHHCAQPTLRRFGLENTVRPSLAVYNDKSDVDALIAALRHITGAGGPRPPA